MTYHIGVFACKGGVGKTTVVAHLAIILAELGYSVVLVDEDPERHLKRIVGNVIIVQSRVRNKRSGGKDKTLKNQLRCYTTDEVDRVDLSIYDFVLYDFPPSLHGVSATSILNLNYCIVPVNLSPLSIGLNCEIITKTFNYMSQLNSSVKLLALINNEMDGSHPVSKSLKQEFKETLRQYKSAHLIPISIKHSKHLHYWDGGNSFSGIGRHGNMHDDFLILADYLIKIIR